MKRDKILKILMIVSLLPYIGLLLYGVWCMILMVWKEIEMKKILVTGGTVFVSRYVAEYFAKQGNQVFVLNRNSRPQSEKSKTMCLSALVPFIPKHYRNLFWRNGSAEEIRYGEITEPIN